MKALPRVKKSLGQHFLTSQKTLEKIVEVARLKEGETVLEIGPGGGALTRSLLNAGARVIAVEKDDELIPLLEETFAQEIATRQLTLIHNDILNFKPEDRDYQLKAKNYKLIANIPYYLTGQILRQFIASGTPPTLAVLMLQKEVAERITARDGKESILSVSVKAYGTPRYIRTVPAGSFSPPPKVASAVLLVDNINRSNFLSTDEKKFFSIVKRGFAQKRKMLKNNLGIKGGELAACGVAPKARAEDLTLEQWLCLAKLEF